MNLKQRFSVLAALLLPVIALSAFLFFAPTQTSAASCPPGYWYPGESCSHNYCNDGHSGCTIPPGGQGIFVYCKNVDGQASGPGICSMTGSCVKCTYGIY
jgi:hypothetical protein